jgi:hypothetical protein
MAALLAQFKEEHLANASNTSSLYALEQRFYMSSTPTSVQPLCDAWCQTQDLCDKEFGGIVQTSGSQFTTCLGWTGAALFNKQQTEQRQRQRPPPLEGLQREEDGNVRMYAP